MATIQFENGKEVEFDGVPTPEDVDFVAQQIGIARGGTPKKNREQLQTEATQAEAEAQKGVGRRFAEELPKETAKAFLKNPAKLAVSGALAPVDIARQVSGRKPISTELPFVGKTFQAEAQERLETGASSLGTIGRAALEVPLAGAETIGVGKGVKILAKGTQATQAIKKTAPLLRGTKEQAAKEAGRVYTSLFGKVKLTPNVRDLEVAKSVEKIITSSNPFKNISRVKNAIAKTDDVIKAGIAKNNVPVFERKLRYALAQAKENSRVVFGSDKTLEGAYDSVVNEMVLQFKKAGGKDLGQLFQARQNFDRVIKQKFPNLFSKLTSDLPRTNAVLDVRRAVNDYVSFHLPPDSPFKSLLHKSTLMFEAVKNISAKAPEIGTSKIRGFFKKPIVKYGAGTVLGGAGFEGGRRLLPASE